MRPVSTDTATTFDPHRAIRNLKNLAARTGGPAGSRRLCWTAEWAEARALLREELSTLPVTVEQDEAGNLWAYLPGRSADTVVVGSHLDSVPAGGWLDGALGVMGGLEVLRSLAARPEPPARSFALVDWADEEGARFGRSLFGSAAVVGTLDSLYTALAESGQAGEDEEAGYDLLAGVEEAVATVPANLADLSNALLDPLGIGIGDVSDLETAAEEQEVGSGTFGAMTLVLDGHRTWRQAGGDAAEIILRGVGIATDEAREIVQRELEPLQRMTAFSAT